MPSYVRRKTPGDTDWFVRDRFGMFIHFGLYSVAGRHEWIKSKECMSEENYDRYFKEFNPDLLTKFIQDATMMMPKNATTDGIWKIC